MIKFLIKRPIAVIMAFTACFIVGLVTYFTIPVSLLPDIAIPQITVQVDASNTSARELENTVVTALRQQLIQVSTLEEISSETSDGLAVIHLSFDYGVNTDLAFIEVNEKIDAAMNYLPKEISRPKVIKASATDIPVYYLNLTLKEDQPYTDQFNPRFLEMSKFADQVIRRRFEQLSEVAMVDMTGVVNSELQIIPDNQKMKSLNFSIYDIKNALSQNNVEPGSMHVKDGYYLFNVKFSNILRTLDDVRNIYIKKEGRIFQLKDICQANIVPVEERGISTYNGKKAITFAIIKQADENMANMKGALNSSIEMFQKKFPFIEFNISRNQTELLDYTISNLQQNLSIGLFLIFIVAILFLGDVKSPFIIALSMVVSIVISFAFFYLFNISLNIISLSGLILALGMMIDSSIIVTENISQYREKGLTLSRACIKGTSEVMTPMLSSSLTTIAVFFPLIFMSGIAGAIFKDQAFSVAVGLMISYFTGIILLPVLYNIVYRPQHSKKKSFWRLTFKRPIKDSALIRFYDRTADWIFSHKVFGVIFTLIALPLCFFLFVFMRKERMPKIDQVELVAHVDWNENIHLAENTKRVNQLFLTLKNEDVEQSAFIGEQSFWVDQQNKNTLTESELYFKTTSPEKVQQLKKEINQWILKNYPEASFSFAPPETVFERIFSSNEADIEARFFSSDKSNSSSAYAIHALEDSLREAVGVPFVTIPFSEQLNIVINNERLLLYHISYDTFYSVLKSSFKQNNVATLHSFQQSLPINVVEEEQTIDEILNNTLVTSTPNNRGKVHEVALKDLVRVVPAKDLKSITAGRDGEYVPFKFHDVNDEQGLVAQIKSFAASLNKWDVSLTGSFFSNAKMMGELVIILLISIILMYFILASQFESFVQPLLVLIEIPIDIAFGLLLLLICGHTLNLMSAIGLIVTCGIVINDSILKLDVINELRKSGVPLIEAIHEAGRRRLRPIIMTSLTTIFAMVPLLFAFDMGSELQKPLAIGMIGTMVIGTFVSLFIVPLFYWFIYHKKENK